MTNSAITSKNRMLTLEQLRNDVSVGAIDTVLVVLTDMQGRLMGKHVDAQHFLNEMTEHGGEACNYLLAVDVDMRTVDGYALSSWSTGYGDMVMKPDFGTLRKIPWLEKSAMIQVDLEDHDHYPVKASPRQILKQQLGRLAEHNLTALAATELEFIVFKDSYETAWQKGYRDLIPANFYNVDYSMIGTSRVEPLIGRIRRDMAQAGLIVENSKGECNFGQHEVNFKYKDALATADDHVVYKTGAKEIASQMGMSLTFMAKYNEREGNSCHIHFSLRTTDGKAIFKDKLEMFEHFLAGQLACLREFSLFYAPNINSYKRYAVGSFAPTAVAWGRDNRTCGYRVVGSGSSLRVENRVPGADVNPYLALSAMIAAGLYGIENKLPLESEFKGNAYASDKPRVPGTMREARDLFASSKVAKAAFGDEVIAHYLNYADVELQAFESAVTDWERVRGFERL
jgi:glutamine synthetase